MAQSTNSKMVGATAGTKAAIAALVGAGQGAISTATKAVVAALPTTLRWFLSRYIIQRLEPYKTASLGSYIKVAGATITSANIAAEYAKTKIQ
jgi:hypothetical protein